LSPPGDRALLRRPEFKAMFIDDLINGSRRQISAPLSDVLVFSRHWGFELADVKAPVRWWHGDSDNIVPLEHGEHVVARLPDATLKVLPGDGHLGGLGVSEEILATLLDVWDEGL
jgi:pimeloyl-ACP methyl ester carboxylesterase